MMEKNHGCWAFKDGATGGTDAPSKCPFKKDADGSPCGLASCRESKHKNSTACVMAVVNYCSKTSSQGLTDPGCWNFVEPSTPKPSQPCPFDGKAHNSPCTNPKCKDASTNEAHKKACGDAIATYCGTVAEHMMDKNHGCWVFKDEASGGTDSPSQCPPLLLHA